MGRALPGVRQQKIIKPFCPCWFVILTRDKDYLTLCQESLTEQRHRLDLRDHRIPFDQGQMTGRTTGNARQ